MRASRVHARGAPCTRVEAGQHALVWPFRYRSESSSTHRSAAACTRTYACTGNAVWHALRTHAIRWHAYACTHARAPRVPWCTRTREPQAPAARRRDSCNQVVDVRILGLHGHWHACHGPGPPASPAAVSSIEEYCTYAHTRTYTYIHTSTRSRSRSIDIATRARCTMAHATSTLQPPPSSCGAAGSASWGRRMLPGLGDQHPPTWRLQLPPAWKQAQT